MPVEVIFPRVDMDMTAGTLARWFVADGEAVEKGAPLFEIETSKAAMEIESPATGILRARPIAAGAEVGVGVPVGWIVAPGEDWSPETVAADAAPAPSVPAAPPPAAPVQAAAPMALRATPLARREAARRRLDLAAIRGTGPRGRIVHADVVAAAPAAPQARAPHPAPPPDAAAPAPSANGLHLRRSGTAHGTPVVLLHGFGSDLSIWHDVSDLLAASRPVVALDLPGHGRSPAGPATHAELTEAVIATLQDAGVERCHLVGHSLGGAVALGIVATLPDLVRSLGLIAPAGLGPEIDAAFLAGFVAAEQPASMAPWLRRLVSDPALVTDGFVRATLRAQAAPGRREAQRALLARLFPDGTQALSLAGALDRVTVPVKLIWGQADAIIPPRHARGLPAHVAVHLAPGIGHLPQLEAPHLVARLITELSAAG